MRTRQRYIDLKITLDERIADGFVFAQAASTFQRLISRPELLDLSLEDLRRTLELGSAEPFVATYLARFLGWINLGGFFGSIFSAFGRAGVLRKGRVLLRARSMLPLIGSS